MKEIISNKLLLVEGNDDKKFFESFLKYEEIENVQVERVKGKPEFENKIPGFVIRPDFNKIEMLAIIRDANSDGMNNAFLSIKNIFERIEGYELIPPQSPNSFSNSYPEIGIFIITKPKSNKGILEDLCLATVKNTDAMKCVNIFWDCLKVLPNKPKNPSKSLCQAYRAAMPKSVPHIGIAAEMGFWDFSSKFLDELRDFLNNFK